MAGKGNNTSTLHRQNLSKKKTVYKTGNGVRCKKGDVVLHFNNIIPDRKKSGN